VPYVGQKRPGTIPIGKNGDEYRLKFARWGVRPGTVLEGRDKKITRKQEEGDLKTSND